MFVEWSLAEPFLSPMDHTKRNPSFTFPRVAKYCEFELQASARTPNVCSVSMESGISGGASFAVEKIKTLGL